MPDTLSEKSTKSQILEAYNEAMKKLKEAKQEDRKAEKKKEDESEIVKQALENSVDKIINVISGVKIQVMNELDDVGEKLSTEFKKLSGIKKAIEIENQYLEDVYQIKSDADTLSALLTAQKEKRASFEAEMEKRRAEFDEEMSDRKIQWKQDQDNYDKAKKEKELADRKEKERLEEEYKYSVALERKKDTDAYSEKKALLEKELIQKKEEMMKDLVDRETSLAAREKESGDLEAKVEQFPAQLEAAVKQTEKDVTERIETRYKHQFELTQRELDGERKLNKQIIQSLENKIKEQADFVRQLTEKADDAGKQVQMIAVKAIEGAATQRAIAFEKVAEQSKSKDNS